MDTALELAIEQFKKIDLRNIHERTGASFNKEEIQIEYLNRKYSIYLPEKETDIPSREKIIILHYLNKGKGVPLSGKLIDFRGIPGGNMYYPVFEKRVHKPFLETFGERPSLLLQAGLSLKGTKTDFGDFSVKIFVFPKIPIDFVIYKGDEEFPSNCKVLFDSNISDYLTTEDIVVVCEDTVKELTVNLNTL